MSQVIRCLHAVPELPQWAPECVVNPWELSRGGANLQVEDEAAALARLDHPEFFLLWDQEDNLPAQFPVGSTNPRVHVLTHQIVETQLIQNDPPEVRTALAHLLEQGVDRHTAIHLIMEGLIREIHSAATDKWVHDADRYRNHLEHLSRARVGGVRSSQRVGSGHPAEGSSLTKEVAPGWAPSSPNRRRKLFPHWSSGSVCREHPENGSTKSKLAAICR